MMANFWLVLVLTSTLFAYAGYAYAKKTNRNPVLWAVGGAVLNVAILVAMFVIGNRSPRVKSSFQ